MCFREESQHIVREHTHNFRYDVLGRVVAFVVSRTLEIGTSSVFELHLLSSHLGSDFCVAGWCVTAKDEGGHDVLSFEDVKDGEEVALLSGENQRLFEGAVGVSGFGSHRRRRGEVCTFQTSPYL